LDEFGDLPNVWECYGGYGTRSILIHQSAFENEGISECLESLDHYPVMDEDHLSQLELDLERQSWDDWVKWDLERELHESQIPEDEDKFKDLFFEVVRINNIYPIFEDANSPYWDLEDVVKVWPIESKEVKS
jgi:hypothetical protein